MYVQVSALPLACCSLTFIGKQHNTKTWAAYFAEGCVEAWMSQRMTFAKTINKVWTSQCEQRR